MKNYRYHVLQANRSPAVSTHRNPVQAFLSAERYALELPAGYGVKDTQTGGFFVAGSFEFKEAKAAAEAGERDFRPPPLAPLGDR